MQLILFMDEITIELFPKSKVRQGIFRTENRKAFPKQKTVKFSPKLTIAGG